jgi:hypothetical protein
VKPRTQTRIGKNATKLADEGISSGMWGLYKPLSDETISNRLIEAKPTNLNGGY